MVSATLLCVDEGGLIYHVTLPVWGLLNPFPGESAYMKARLLMNHIKLNEHMLQALNLLSTYFHHLTIKKKHSLTSTQEVGSEETEIIKGAWLR